MKFAVQRAEGVGDAAPAVAVNWVRESVFGTVTVRLDCPNNPAFWLEVDVDKMEARGRIATSNASQGGFEVALMGSGALSVTHPACPGFVIELAPDLC